MNKFEYAYNKAFLHQIKQNISPGGSFHYLLTVSLLKFISLQQALNCSYTKRQCEMSPLRVFHCCSRSRKPRRLPAEAERLRLRAQQSRPSGGVRWRLVSETRWSEPKQFLPQQQINKHKAADWFYV